MFSNTEPVDMFADTVTASESSPMAPPSEDEVKWEYRWENKEDTEIHGPFSSTQMSEWVESGWGRKAACREDLFTIENTDLKCWIAAKVV